MFGIEQDTNKDFVVDIEACKHLPRWLTEPYPNVSYAGASKLFFLNVFGATTWEEQKRLHLLAIKRDSLLFINCWTIILSEQPSSIYCDILMRIVSFWVSSAIILAIIGNEVVPSSIVHFVS